MINYLENLPIFHYSILVIVVIWLLITIYASKFAQPNSWISKLGISLGSKQCPNCNTTLPIIRKPKNSRQLLYGGWTCEKCGTEVDKYGEELE